MRGVRTGALRVAGILVMGMLAATCASTPGAESEAEPTYLNVDNQSRYDMTIYVIRSSGQRIRLGRATSNMQTRLLIPPDLMFGLTSLRFLADPLAGNVSPVSDEIVVTPGDEITLRIPPM